MKNPRFDPDYAAPLEFPDENKIPCKDCMLREKDRTLGKGTVLKGATLGICDAFGIKPSYIIDDGEDCPYYIKED